MADLNIKINNEYLPKGVKIAFKSLSIDEGQPGNPSLLNFDIIDNNLISSPFIWKTTKGLKVEVFENGILKFGGQIDVPTTRKINNYPQYKEKIVCIDWTAILQHRYINKSYPKLLISDIAKDFIDTFLYEDGFWYDSNSIQETTSKYASINYSYTYAIDAFIELASLINWIWWIGPDKKVYFKEQTTNISTIQLIENETFYIPESLTIEEDPSEYRNIVILKDVNALTDELIEKASPTPDKDRAYRVSFSINDKPSIYLSLIKNIEEPLESERVDPTQVGIGGIDSGLQFYWNKNTPEITQDLDADEIPSDRYVVVKYIGQYKIDVIEENSSSITSRINTEGTSGKYETVSSGSNIEGIVIAENYANALLDKFSGDIPKKITFSSYSMDIKNGYFMDVIIPSFNINSLTSEGNGYLVMDKRIKDMGAGLLLKTYVLVSGAPIGGWIKYLKDKYQGEQDFTIREDSLVSVPLYEEEEMAIDGVLVMKTYDCLYPEDTLYPADNLYPGTLTDTITEYD